MRHFILTVLLSMAVPAYAQMSTFQDSSGITGMTFQTGPNMGTYQDNTGRQGTYQQFGNQGMWQDNRGNSGQWMDLRPNMRTFNDTKGGSGQSFDFGNGMGSYTYQTPRGSTQGQYWQYGR